jgi:plastocyanin
MLDFYQKVSAIAIVKSGFDLPISDRTGKIAVFDPLSLEQTMRFVRSLVFVAACFVGVTAHADDKWVTVKGQVKLSKVPDHIKVLEKVDVKTDAPHCLGKGPQFKQNFVISKTGDFSNVIVYLRPDSDERDAKFKDADIHPDLRKPKSTNHVIDQPCCQFEPRVTVAREGDTLEVKNSSPVNHNFSYSSNENGTANPNIPPGESYKFASPLKFEPRYFKFACSVHPWMGGCVQVFNHPYYAITDKDGKFEIKNAPAGKFRIVYYHEEGYHKGSEGRSGFPIVVDGKGGTMEMKPQEYEFVKPKS